jgi:hypothetical protein
MAQSGVGGVRLSHVSPAPLASAQRDERPDAQWDVAAVGMQAVVVEAVRRRSGTAAELLDAPRRRVVGAKGNRPMESYLPKCSGTCS